ncbi:hypothetical protein QC762_000630 [Podospora pseudocomata]|uniref:Oxalate decarboxylase n=1 Tax=Podospora pseudocomata TaxID=2093779 RepID=A0ABR0GPA9_9PEZI|nr:hypothetical protein QC762_000630 [Podospora pseudocomata]
MPKLMWPMGILQDRSGTGKNSGWARQRNASVSLRQKSWPEYLDMRLAPSTFRQRAGLDAQALNNRIGDPAASRTFDFAVGGDRFVPAAEGHFIENTGTKDLIFLDVLQVPEFNDISIAQWLVLTPKQLVKDHCIFPIQSLML